MTNPLTTLTTLTARLLDPAGRFAVLDSCSGINSLKALLALALILAFINRTPPHRACILLFTAAVLSIFFNQLRVLAIITIGTLYPSAFHPAHTILGYLFVLPSIYILVILSERLYR
ncbi:MAG: exosortase/archaeosortase family protein [Kiritimatiellae bacterium]|nr:exosortase/archaeosortase family protein [Kiritimatiellia bacterium]